MPKEYQYTIGERVVGIYSRRVGSVTGITPAGPQVIFDGDTESQTMHGKLHIMPLEKQEPMAKEYEFKIGERVVSLSSGNIGTIIAFSQGVYDVAFEPNHFQLGGYTAIVNGARLLPAEKQEVPTKSTVGDLRTKISKAINCVSAENGSNTPDFILAEYLTDCLAAFDRATKAREKWYGRIDDKDTPTQLE